MRWDLIEEIADSYKGKNLQEDIKLAVAQTVVNRSKTKKEACTVLGIPQSTINSWIRKGWVVQPGRFSQGRGRFKKGEVRDPELERRRREGLKKTFIAKGYKLNKLAST